MKNTFLFIIFLANISFAQVKEYSINTDKGTKVDALMRFENNTFAFCTSKQSFGYKSNNPTLIKLNDKVEEIYNIGFIGFTGFMDISYEGSMLNNYRRNPRATGGKNEYRFINKNGKLFDVTKSLMSGGEHTNNNGLRFIIDNTQYTIGTKSGKEYSKKIYSSDDFQLYKYNMVTGETETNKMDFGEFSNTENSKKFRFYYAMSDENSFTIEFEKSTRDVKEKLYTQTVFITYDLNGNEIKETIIGAPLEDNKNIALNTVFYDQVDKVYYNYGFYHEHKNPNRKLAITNYKGYYIQKYDASGKALFKIQAPFISDIFDKAQSVQDCIFTLNKVNVNRLLFSYGNTDIDILDELIIDKNSGEILEDKKLEFNLKYNNYVKYPHTVAHRIIKDTYGKKNYFDINSIQLLSIHEGFSNYVKELKDSKSKINYKSFIVEDGFVVFQGDNENREFKFLKFNW